MRQAGPPHPGSPKWVSFFRPTRTKRNLATILAVCAFAIGVGIQGLDIKIAQAVIVEAEPHRRRFPNFACGRSLRLPAPRWPLRGALPPAVRSGTETRRRRGLGIILLQC